MKATQQTHKNECEHEKKEMKVKCKEEMRMRCREERERNKRNTTHRQK